MLMTCAPAGLSIVRALQGWAAAYRGEQQGHALLPEPHLSRPGWASSVAALTGTAGLYDPADLSDEQAASLNPVRAPSNICGSAISFCT